MAIIINYYHLNYFIINQLLLYYLGFFNYLNHSTSYIFKASMFVPISKNFSKASRLKYYLIKENLLDKNCRLAESIMSILNS